MVSPISTQPLPLCTKPPCGTSCLSNDLNSHQWSTYKAINRILKNWLAGSHGWTTEFLLPDFSRCSRCCLRISNGYQKSSKCITWAMGLVMPQLDIGFLWFLRNCFVMKGGSWEVLWGTVECGQYSTDIQVARKLSLKFPCAQIPSPRRFGKVLAKKAKAKPNQDSKQNQTIFKKISKLCL